MGILRTIGLAVLGTALLATTGAAAPGVVQPSRSYLARADILAFGLAGSTVAVAVGETKKRCPQVELWTTKSKRPHRFRSTLWYCKHGLSTGFGLTSVQVAGNRALWIEYGGGNTREWVLWTGTTTSAPKRLRLARQGADTSDPPPIVLGPGTARGVPYAVGAQVVYKPVEGKAIFRTILRAPVLALTAGAGPKGVEVAALLRDGWVVALDGLGHEYAAQRYEPGAVQAIALSGAGVAVQVGSGVRIVAPRAHEGPTVTLPSGARMLDVAQRRVLYALRGDLWAARIDTGSRTLLVDGTPAKPAYGQLDARGFAWTRGRTVAWRPGTLP